MIGAECGCLNFATDNVGGGCEAGGRKGVGTELVRGLQIRLLAFICWGWEMSQSDPSSALIRCGFGKSRAFTPARGVVAAQALRRAIPVEIASAWISRVVRAAITFS